MLHYIDVIPAKTCVARHESLNILGGVANDGGAVTVDISVWGRASDTWERLATNRTEIRANEHKHIYFTLTPDCFSAERWHEEIEDIELITDHEMPDADARGVIIFVE